MSAFRGPDMPVTHAMIQAVREHESSMRRHSYSEILSGVAAADVRARLDDLRRRLDEYIEDQPWWVRLYMRSRGWSPAEPGKVTP